MIFMKSLYKRVIKKDIIPFKKLFKHSFSISIMAIKGKVIQFRQGRHTLKEKHFIIDVNLKKRADAEKFIGREISWTSPAGKVIKGKVSGAHGNKGLVRAIFEKGLPGQAIGTKVEIKA